MLRFGDSCIPLKSLYQVPHLGSVHFIHCVLQLSGNGWVVLFVGSGPHFVMDL